MEIKPNITKCDIAPHNLTDSDTKLQIRSVSMSVSVHVCESFYFNSNIVKRSLANFNPKKTVSCFEHNAIIYDTI